MGLKFIRDYTLLIQMPIDYYNSAEFLTNNLIDSPQSRARIAAAQAAPTQFISIAPPFSLEFDISRNDYATGADATLQIFNLNQNTRGLLRVDQVYVAPTAARLVLLYAGYLSDQQQQSAVPTSTPITLGSSTASTFSNLPLIFAGFIRQAESTREGVDFITSLDCQGFPALQPQSYQFSAGVTQDTMIKTIAKSLAPQIQVGAIGNYPGTKPRGNSFSGGPMQLLAELTGGGAFVDNAKVHCLNLNEVIDGPSFVVDSSTGLIGTPSIQGTFLHMDMIFEPRMQVGSQIILNSITASGSAQTGSLIQINGPHRISGVKHRGMISDAVCGEAVTSVSCLPLLNGVPVAQGVS